MRQIVPFALWLGHVGDVRNWHTVFDVGSQAIVDLAGNEPPASPPRDLIYCRFPRVDGAGNAPRLLEAEIRLIARPKTYRFVIEPARENPAK